MKPAMRKWGWIFAFWLLLIGGVLLAFADPHVRTLAMFEIAAAGILVIALLGSR